MKKMISRNVLVLLSFATACAWSDPATGWLRTGAGSYEYNDAANWVNGEGNGVFGSDLTLSADQTIVFGADVDMDGLDIAFAGDKTLTFASDGSARKLTLRGKTKVNIASAAKVVVGTTADVLALNVEDGPELFVSCGTVEIGSKISGSGGFKVSGGDASNSLLQILNGDNDFSGVVEISGGKRSCHVCFAAAGALPASGASILLSDGGVLRSCPSAGYTCAWYASSGLVDRNSTGTLCIGAAESTDVDLSPYPYLAFGSSGGNFTFSGKLTVADDLYRIRTVGNHLYFAQWNVFTGTRNVLIEHQTPSESVYLQAGNDLAGTITVCGGGFVLQGKNGAAQNADIVLKRPSQMFLQASANKAGAKSITLQSSTLIVSGGTSADVTHTLSGVLRIDGSAGGCSFVKMTSNNAKGVALRAAKLEMPLPAVLAVEGDGLGAAFGANASNVFFDEAPALVGGGGAAGTITVSIVPRLTGSAASGGSSPDKYKQSFVTYDPANGLRPLNLETEYATVISAQTPTANVKVPFGTSLVIDGEKTVNALLFQGAGSGTPARYLVPAEGVENAKVVVTSGQVVLGMQPKSACYLSSVSLDFGSATGVLWHEIKNTQYFEAGFSGSGGLVYVQPQTTLGSEKATWLQGGVGDLSGRIWAMSTGMFGPNFLSSLVNRNEDVIVPSGACLRHNVATSVQGYRLYVDGSVPVSSITVENDSTLAGSGTFAKLVILKKGAKLEAGSSSDGAAGATLTFNGGLSVSGDAELEVQVLSSGETGSVSIGGSFTVANNARLKVMASDRFRGDRLAVKGAGLSLGAFARGRGCRELALRADGTELWMCPSIPGSVIVFR